MKFRSNRPPALAGLPNTLPLTEVILFLLLARIGASEVGGPGFELRVKPAQVSAAATAGKPPALIRVVADRSGGLHVWGRPVDLAGLAQRFKKAKRGTIVQILPDADCPAQALTDVIATAAEAKLEPVLAVHKKASGPARTPTPLPTRFAAATGQGGGQ